MDVTVESVDMSHGARLAAYSAVSTSLALYSDRELSDLLDTAVPLGSGIGGTSALLEVDGTPVFVKRLPLSDLEQRPENVRSTANLFELPLFCHYGLGAIGAPSFGAWRELAVHTMTTNWVLAREYEGFPLMYHARALPHPGQSLPEDLADVEGAIAYWGGGPEVRGRIEALRDSSASVALFLEYIPQNLHTWLDGPIRAGGESAGRACGMVARELEAGISFMNARGLLHFDTHFENILTDGHRLFFTDYGISISSRFDLSPQEAAFFAGHQTYDRCYSVTHLVLWLSVPLYGYDADERGAFVRACARGDVPSGLPPQVAAVLSRHSPVAEVMTDFYREFRVGGRQARYPLEAIGRLVGPDASSPS